MSKTSPESMTLEEAVTAQQEAKHNATAWQNQERALRAAIVAKQFNVDKTGTQKIDLENGRTLKAVIIHNMSLPKRPEIDACIKKMDQAVAGRLFKWKAELSVSEYKKLDEKQRKIVNTIITTKPGSHTLEVVEPKVDEVLPEIV